MMYTGTVLAVLGLAFTASAIPTPGGISLTEFEDAVTKAAHDILVDGAKFSDISDDDMTPKDVSAFQSGVTAALATISTAEGEFLKTQGGPAKGARDLPFPISIQQFNDNVAAAGKAIIQAAVTIANVDKDTVPSAKDIDTFQSDVKEGMQNITQAEQGLIASKSIVGILHTRDNFDPNAAFTNLAATVENVAQAAKDASQAIVDTVDTAAQSLADNSVTAPGPNATDAAQQGANALVDAAANAVQLVDELAKFFVGNAGSDAPGTFVPQAKRQALPATVPLGPATGALSGAATDPAVANVTVVAQQIALGFIQIITGIVDSFSSAVDQVPGGATTTTDFTGAVNNVQDHVAGVAEELGLPEALNVLAGGIPTNDVNKRSKSGRDSSDWVSIIRKLAEEAVKTATGATSHGAKSPINARNAPASDVTSEAIGLGDEITQGATILGLSALHDTTKVAHAGGLRARDNTDGSAIVGDSFALGTSVTQDAAILGGEIVADATHIVKGGALGDGDGDDSKHADGNPTKI